MKVVSGEYFNKIALCDGKMPVFFATRTERHPHLSAIKQTKMTFSRSYYTKIKYRYSNL